MALGFGLLRLSPEAFWSMTLPELAAALRGIRGEAGLPAAPEVESLRMLMRLFPDERTNAHDG
jgi:uncharacterized phage protein (TIGR02216 family)